MPGQLCGETMSQKANLSKYPLPEALTYRVVSYLNAFRLLISLGLLFALFAGLIDTPLDLGKDSIAGTVLITYFVMAVVIAAETWRHTSQTFFLAQISLFTDILFLSMLLFIFGGLESGVAILLIFASASAAILLPLRIALFFASLVVLAFISESLAGMLLSDETPTGLIQAGLYGTTTFLITILVNILSHWVKDYRLIAERQAAEIAPVGALYALREA